MNVPQPVIAGVGAIPVTRDLTRPIPDLCAATVKAALDDAGVDASEVDGLFVTPAAISSEPWMMFAAQMGEYLGFKTKALAALENGGITALLALRAAMDAVQLGRCKVAVTLALDTRPRFDMAHFESFIRQACFTTMALHGPFNGLMGLGAPVPVYAMSHQRYMHEFNVSEEQVVMSSVRLREHAVDHPWAQFRDPISVDDVLGSKELSPPIHIMQAAGISSGVVALVVTNAETARSLGAKGVTVKGYGEHHHPSHFVPRRGSITRFESVEVAGKEALSQAGVSISDIDVAEVYGVFGATELILYEDLGFCSKGEGAHYLADGRSTFGGDVVIIREQADIVAMLRDPETSATGNGAPLQEEPEAIE
ncbi:MAG TPA: thiolase family protein, partial [Myxococcales bacterium]|nr:thiolase family protein [Myxococcales bacterium]